MGLVTSLPRFRAEGGPNDGPGSDFWYRPAGGSYTTSGMRVSEQTAMKLSAVFACRRAIAQPIGMIPFVMVEYLAGGGKAREPKHPLYPLLHDAPNSNMTAMEFREMLTSHAVLRGDGYALIRPDYQRNLPVGSLVPVHPDAVTTRRNPQTGDITYDVRYDDGHLQTVLFDEMFVLRGMTLDGVNGVSVLEYARENMGFSLATEEYGSRTFKNRPSTSGFLKSVIASRQERLEAMAEYSKQNAGVENAGKVAMLPPGFEFQSSGMTNKDAEWVASMEYDLTRYERWFGVPAHVISDLVRATFSNIEEQAIEYVVYCLNPWGMRWEQSVVRDLLLPSERGRFRGELVWDALLRGKTIERYQAHQMAILSGWKSPNEVRETEGLNRVEGLDEFLIPMNMVPLSQLGQSLEVAKSTAKTFAMGAAHRTMMFEAGKVSRSAEDLATGEGWDAWLGEFYGAGGDYRAKLEQWLHLSPSVAAAIAERHRRAILQGGTKVLEAMVETEVAGLASIAIEDGGPARAAALLERVAG